GVIDTSFGNAGVTIVDDGNQDHAKSLIQKSDGKIVVAGSSTDSNFSVIFKMMRFSAEGDLDLSFGEGGIVSTILPYGQIEKICFQDDGKILVAEYHGTGGCCSADIKLIRFLSEGMYDIGFGLNGIATINFINENSQAQ